MAIQLKYEGSLACMPIIRDNLHSVARNIQALATSPFGEVALKCQDAWLKIYRTNLLLEVAHNHLETQISLYTTTLAAQQKLCSDLQEQLRIEREIRDDLAVKKEGLVGQKKHLEQRQRALERQHQALKSERKKKEDGIAAVATVGAVTAVGAIILAPFSGGLSLLALGATAGSGVGVACLAVELENVVKQINNVTNEIRSVEKNIEKYNEKIREKSNLIKNLEATLKDIKAKISHSDFETKFLGKSLTDTHNERVSLSNLQDSCKRLQGDIKFVQDIIEEGSLDETDIKDLIKNTINIGPLLLY